MLRSLIVLSLILIFSVSFLELVNAKEGIPKKRGGGGTRYHANPSSLMIS